MTVSLPRAIEIDEREKVLLQELAGDVAFALRDVELEEERERLLERTRRQAQRLQQTIDTVPEGVLLLDADHRVILSNPVAERDLDVLAQASAGDVLTQLGGRAIEELLTPPPSERAWHEVEADDRSFEVIARRMTISGDQERWVMVINDTTIEKQVQRQLRQQERLAAVGQLAGGIAHDFNNILAAIILYAQMPLSSPDLAPRTEYALQTILEESHRAADLVQQILDFSRSAMMETKPVSLATLVRETTALLRRTIPENIRLVMGVASHPCVVQADPTRIHQALMNLALNAKDAMPEGGKLRIQVERVVVDEGEGLPDMPAGAYARLSVADTGTGLSPEAQEHLFEPFFTTKEVGQGTGLGLAQVHGIVKQHQGFIDVETAAGEGTTFAIFLPLVEDEEGDQGAEEEREIPPQDRSETILVVEDAERLRGAIQAGLDALGYRVLAAANGREALEILSEEEVDVVLTDVVMPEMGGKALLDRLRAAEPALKVIAMTGHVVEKDVEKLQGAGFEAALPKPFSVEELERAVRAVLE
jgi:signal transduction histidine kinase